MGAIVSHSDEEVTAATAAVKNALFAAKSIERIERALTEQLRAARSGRYEVRPLSGREENFSTEDLARQGIDAVLAFQVSPLDLLVSGNEINPDAALRLSVQAKIVDTNSGTATPNWSWEYRGSSLDYFDLAAEDARLLRLSIEDCYPEIGRLMINDLFIDSKASSSGDEALRQPGEAPVQAGRLEEPPTDAAKPTLDEVKQIVRRIDTSVERDSIKFLKEQKVVAEDSISISLVSWDIIAVTRESFTLEVFLRFRTGAAETFKLRGRIDNEKLIYTEVLDPESKNPQ